MACGGVSVLYFFESDENISAAADIVMLMISDVVVIRSLTFKPLVGVFNVFFSGFS